MSQLLERDMRTVVVTSFYVMFGTPRFLKRNQKSFTKRETIHNVSSELGHEL